jgi:hypothetical protein
VVTESRFMSPHELITNKARKVAAWRQKTLSTGELGDATTERALASIGSARPVAIIVRSRIFR